MIGQLLDEAGGVVAELSDAGEWTAPDAEYEPVAKVIDATDNPYTSFETGDQRVPIGVAALNRAAARYNLTPKLAVAIEPLPPGAVS